MSSQTPRIRLVKKSRAPAAVRAIFEEIQDTMGIPWVPANWQAYAAQPDVLRIFWSRLQPMVATEAFVQATLELLVSAYRGVTGIYHPSAGPELPEAQRAQIHRELNALEFGNAQLLLQQAALTRVLRDEVAGCEGHAEPRLLPSPFRRPDLELVDERSASPEVKRLFKEIRETLGLPIVNTDYQVLAKWMEFFEPSWRDLEQHRQQEGYFELCGKLTHLADRLVSRLQPAVSLDGRELIVAFGDNREAVDNLQRQVQLFTALMPGLIVNDAMLLWAVSMDSEGADVTPAHHEEEMGQYL